MLPYAILINLLQKTRFLEIECINKKTDSVTYQI